MIKWQERTPPLSRAPRMLSDLGHQVFDALLYIIETNLPPVSRARVALGTSDS